MLIINFVYDKDALTIKKFLKKVEYDDIINYMDITNKLTKNDIYSVEPSDAIISSYITKYLEKILIQNSNITICYVLSSFNLNIITNVQKFLRELLVINEINDSITFNIYLKNDMIIDNSVMPILSKFDNFYELTL